MSRHTITTEDLRFLEAAKLEARMAALRKEARPMVAKTMADKKPHHVNDLATAVADALQAKGRFTEEERGEFLRDLKRHIAIHLNTAPDKTHRAHRRYLAEVRGGAYQMIEHASQKAHDREAERLRGNMKTSGDAADAFLVRYAQWHNGQTPPALRAFARGLDQPPANDEKPARSRKRPAAEVSAAA